MLVGNVQINFAVYFVLSFFSSFLILTPFIWPAHVDI